MPKINTREFQALLDEKKAMVPLYTPEWDISDEKDVGAALLKIFTHMQMEIINRLNRVPDKHFTAFLELLGIKLMPAQPARVPVTFYLSKKHSGGVFVPPGTKVATEETDNHSALIFETVNGFYAANAAIKEVYCADPEKDEIFCYSDDLSEKKEFKLFEGDNLQKHVLYLGHDEYFNLKEPTQIKLEFNFMSGSVEELVNYRWEYWGEDEDKPVQFDKLVKNTNIIILKSKGEIKKKKIHGIESHWIHCKIENVTGNLPVIKSIKIKNINAESIQPDLGFYNGIPLDVTKEFYPFGTTPRLFDTFYLGSKEAFSKKGVKITITFSRTDKPDPVPNNVELLWEYWNGTVWQLLHINNDENTINNFTLYNSTGYIKFNCPDIKETSVGGHDSYWIRVRLIKGDYGKEEIKSEKPLLFSIPYQENIQIPDGLKQGFTDNEIYLSELINTNEITTGKWIIVDYETNNVYFVEKDNSHLNVYRKVTWAAIPNFKPPVITGIDITYSFNQNDQKNLQYCLAKNNREWRYFTQESKDSTGFKPFIPLPDNHPTIYLGFNNAFKKGNISIFFSLVDELFSQVTGAKVHWSYWKRAQNLYEKMTSTKKLHLISTEGISKGVELILEETTGMDVITQTVNIQSCSDKKIALDRELDFYYSKAARVMQRNHLEVFDHTEYITKNGTLEFIGPADHEEIQKFGKKKYWVAGTLTNVTKDYDPPLIKGIYPNTVWAEQVETIKDEILGSGDGKKDRSYQFTRSPIISPEVWVMEGEIIPEDEKKNLSQDRIKEIKDNTGKVKETWIKWKAVEDFTGSDPRSRDYMMDCSMGMMTFGDGEKGMIPLIGKDNIRADYKSGGGVEGNLPVNEITVLKSPAGGIDHIINHEPAEGGSDTELLEEVFERGPHLIKHRDRAVTREDFERLAREASNYIARTKCVPEGNTLYIIIIPKGEEDKPLPSRGLKEIVKNYLLSRRLNLISAERIQVEAPSYVEVQVTADIISKSIEDAVPLEKEILKRLRAFFHPLTGGNERRGWEFGRDVHISDVYAMLEGIDGVDHVENLELNGRNTDVSIDKMKTACTDQHRITMKLGVTQ